MAISDHSKKLRGLLKELVNNLGVNEKDQIYCCDITLSQCFAILEVGKTEELTLNELAESLNVDKSTASRTVNNLAKSKLLAVETDHLNRRFIKIKLTEAGKELYRRLEQRTDVYFSDLVKSIPEDKLEQVIESLHLLVQATENCDCCK